jgi:hypothetical protein
VNEQRIQNILEAAKQNNIKLPQEALLLIHGVKPAFIQADVGNRKQYMHFLKAFFPSIGFPHRNNCFLIFKDAQTMADFLAEGVEVGMSLRLGTTIMDYKHEVLGRYLGFAPDACKWFAETQYQKTGIKLPRANIFYHGIQFVCPLEMIDYCVEWLQTNRPVPDNVKTYAQWSYTDSEGKRVAKTFENNLQPN